MKSIILSILVLFGFVSKNLDGLNQAEKEAAIYLGKLDGSVIYKNGKIKIEMHGLKYKSDTARAIEDKDIDTMVALKEKLNDLYLETDNISSFGFKKLYVFRNLTWLRIMSHNFNDTCKEIFLSYSKLTTLFINHAKITGETLKEIGKIKTITRLDLNDTTIIDDDLRYLAGLTELNNLVLSKTKITDKGLKILSEFNIKNIEILVLTNTNITDEGAEYLLKIKSLSNIVLFGTKVTKGMIKRLEKELNSPDKPSFQIEYD